MDKIKNSRPIRVSDVLFKLLLKANSKDRTVDGNPVSIGKSLENRLKGPLENEVGPLNDE